MFDLRRQHLAYEVGQSLHEGISISGSSSSGSNGSISPTSPAYATAATPTLISSASLSSSLSSSVTIFPPTPNGGDIWVALVLEPNKFAAQSLLHYCKLLCFDSEFSFTFDVPTDLLKYAQGNSAQAARSMRRRTGVHSHSHTGSNGGRRRVVVFANAQYKDQIDQACGEGVAEKFHGWVWITSHAGASALAQAAAVAAEPVQRGETLSKPIFFSDLARCLLKLFHPRAFPGLWATYFPLSPHYNTIGKSSGTDYGEYEFSRAYP